MYNRVASQPNPPFCGFAVPLRVAQDDAIFFKKRPTREQALYEEFERQWESRWSGNSTCTACIVKFVRLLGVVERKTSFVAPRATWSIRTKVFSLLSAKTRELSSDASDSDGSEFSTDVDNFMPPFPKGYKDPAAIY